MRTLFFFLLVLIQNVGKSIYINIERSVKYDIKPNKSKNSTTFFLSKRIRNKRKFQNGSLANAKKYANKYTIKNPLKCQVDNIIKLTGPNSNSEVYHIEINHNHQFQYVEGQSCGIIPYFLETKNIENGKEIESGSENKSQKQRKENETGIEKEKKKYKIKLYSISSSNSKNISIAVKIHKYYEYENKKKIEKYGHCSSYIKTLQINHPIYITGSHGTFVLPDNILKNNTNLILIGTGTGISPYISFIKKIFGNTEREQIENEKQTMSLNEKQTMSLNEKQTMSLNERQTMSLNEKQTMSLNKKHPIYNGVIHLFYGIYNEDSILYLKELEYFKKKFPDNLHIHYIFSSIKKSDGSSFYVQDEIASLQEQFWKLFFIDKSELYICGHKNIKREIWNVLKDSPLFDEHSKNRIHVEVY